MSYDASHLLTVGHAKQVYDNLKSAFNAAIESTVGKNLFNGITENGYLASDGTVTAHDSWVTTDYIAVSGLTAVSTSGKNTSNVRAAMNMFYTCTYDANKAFIEQVGKVDTTYTVGAGVAFIRFSWHPTDFTEVQTESGTAITAYEPYTLTYNFTKSPYLDSYEVDKFNRYIKDDNIVGEYITSSGTISTNSNAARCMVPCAQGEVLEICRPQKDVYSSGNGLMLVLDANKDTLTSVDMDEFATIHYGTYGAVRYPVVTSGAAFISFNVKLSSYDSTNDTVVTNRNINGKYTGNYISEIENYKLWAVNGVEPIWKGKKWACVGDSLTANNIRTTKHYFDYVSDETGIETYNMGDSGSGYAAEQDTDTAFYQRISDVPLDSDVITIFGSFNDLATEVPLGDADDSGTETIGGCINETLDNLFEVLPLANVGIVTPTPWQSQTPLNEPNSASAYVDLLIAVCKRRSIPCLDLFHCSLLRPWDSDFRELAYSKDDGDGTHPDETGHKIIAPRFKAFLETLLM